MFATPGNFGLFDGYPSDSAEQELWHFRAGQPLALGLDDRRVVCRNAI